MVQLCRAWCGLWVQLLAQSVGTQSVVKASAGCGAPGWGTANEHLDGREEHAQPN